MSKLVLYTLSTCSVCDQARTALTQRGVPFEERLLDDREDWQDEVIRLTNQYTVPVLLHPDGRWEVGFEGEVG
ncbi:MAG: glutaredoxin family protein [Bacillota bacterium]